MKLIFAYYSQTKLKKNHEKYKKDNEKFEIVTKQVQKRAKKLNVNKKSVKIIVL